jgi:exodeoxyribonuclease VII small subunit
MVSPAFLLICCYVPDIIKFSFKFSQPPERLGQLNLMAEKKFEAALTRLEEIVKELETGDLPLEQSLKLFEEGIKLSRLCNKRLDDAERRVEILLKSKNGTVTAQPFEEQEGE